MKTKVKTRPQPSRIDTVQAYEDKVFALFRRLITTLPIRAESPIGDPYWREPVGAELGNTNVSNDLEDDIEDGLVVAFANRNNEPLLVPLDHSFFPYEADETRPRDERFFGRVAVLVPHGFIPLWSDMERQRWCDMDRHELYRCLQWVQASPLAPDVTHVDTYSRFVHDYIRNHPDVALHEKEYAERFAKKK